MQFEAAVAVVRPEVEPSAHDRDVVRIPAAAAAVDVGYLPGRGVGSLVRPQFGAAAAVGRLEVKPRAHDHDVVRIPAAAPDVGDASDYEVTTVGCGVIHFSRF